MMRSSIVGIVVMAVMAVTAAESPFKAKDAARAAFNKENGGVFQGTSAVDYRKLPAAERFDQAPGSAKWILALPLKNDSRVRFIAAEFKDGVFQKGEMRKFGLAPETVDAKTFADLRENFALLAIRAESGGKDRKCAFYPAGKVKDTEKKDLPRFGVNLRVDPIGRYTGELCGINQPLGVNIKGLVYVYTMKMPWGDVVEMGSLGDGNKMCAYIRGKLEEMHPDKKGIYSDRYIVDGFCQSEIEYRPAE